MAKVHLLIFNFAGGQGKSFAGRFLGLHLGHNLPSFDVIWLILLSHWRPGFLGLLFLIMRLWVEEPST